MNRNNDLELIKRTKDAASHQTNNGSIRVRQARAHRTFPVFYVVYFTLIALFLIGVGFGLKYLHGILAEYESVQPKYAAEQVFTEYFLDPDIAQLVEMSSTEYAAFEPQEEVIKYLDAQIEGKEITYSESSIKGDGNTRTYNVFCSGARFSVFTLAESGECSEHGFEKYALRDVQLTFSLPENQYKFLLPEGYTLTANGVAVTEKYITGEYFDTDAYKLTSGAAGVRFVPYCVDGFLSTPTFEIKDREGNVCESVYDSESGVLTVGTESVTLHVPKGYTPYIGGVAVTEQFMVSDSETPSVFNQFLEDGVEGINYVSYSVNGFLSSPEIKVKDANGSECKVLYDTETKSYEAFPSYSSELRTNHEKWILDAFETTVLYLQNVKGTKTEVRAFFDTASEAWKGINSINPNWNFEALSYTFEGESVTDFISYDDDHFSCHVRLHYIGRRGSKGLYEETTDKIVFFKKSGDKFLIYNMPNTEAVAGFGVEN